MNYFKLDTPNTSYIFRVDESKHLEQLYYGKKIHDNADYLPLHEKIGTGLGGTVFYSKETGYLNLQSLCLEYSTTGKGDCREPSILIEKENGSFVNDFLFSQARYIDNFTIEGLPTSFGKSKTLQVTCIDEGAKLTLDLFYSVFDDCDVIVKSAKLTNNGEQTVNIRKFASNQLDLPFADLSMQTLDGAWAKERYIHVRPLSQGITSIDSKHGASSATHNPYVLLKRKNADLNCGDCYGFNLIYSGNHCESAEVTIHNKTRFLQGINPFGFCWQLAPKTSFSTPEATLCFSSNGTNALAQSYHHFINNHIVRGKWAKKERPVLVNNWEATYFKFTEKKLLEIASKAKSLGAELFVLDDGWFGKRTDDTKGLGDWVVNKARLPQGLDGLAKQINKLGLSFGLWVEPEMVNPDSDLYRIHPDWAVTHPDYSPSLGRNQLLLDFTNPQVVDYIFESLSAVFSSANISYIKWDYNRNMTDTYSPTLKNQGEFFHRYMLGLYSLLSRLTEKFPDILFESCSSGGNRVDMGILCYMPQFWCSDNTDSRDRVKIQEGTLTCYPQSTLGAHVSASPNHQTLRLSTIDNRFNTACCGLLGYELDLSKLTNAEQKSVKEQIEFYKKWRKTLQFGKYYQLSSCFNGEELSKVPSSWIIVGEQGAVAGIFNGEAVTSPPSDILKLKGLCPDTLYKISNRKQVFPAKQFGDLISHALPPAVVNSAIFKKIIEDGYSLPSEQEEYTAYGDLLCNAGVRLYQQFSSSGYDNTIRIMLDYGSRLYELTPTNPKK